MNTIELNTTVCNGKPVLAGTRIPVTVVLDHLAAGASVADLQRKYPELTGTQIADALRYCHDLIEQSEYEVATA